MQSVTLEDYNYFYNLYLINESYEEQLQSFISTTILDESFVLEGAAIDALKAIVSKIVNSVKEAFQKFVAKVKDLFMKDKDYLNKYKDIIVTVDPIDANITNYYDYDIDKIKNAHVPKFESEKFKKYENDEAFIKGEFPDFVPATDEKFQDKVKSVLRGGSEPKTIRASELDFKKMREYIFGQDEVNKSLNEDLSYIEDGMSKIDKIKFDVVKHSGAATVGKQKSQNASFTYQDTLDYYFNEDGGSNPSGTTPNIQTNTSNANATATTSKPKDNNTSNSNNNSSSSSDNTNDSTVTNNNDKQEETDPDILAAQQKEEEKKQEEEIARVTKMYYRICSNFMGIKFAVASEAYKTYLKIIKWHIDAYAKSHGGDRSGKVLGDLADADKEPEVTKDTKFYYIKKDGTRVDLQPNTDEDAKKMATAGYKHKDSDGEEYAVKIDNGSEGVESKAPDADKVEADKEINKGTGGKFFYKDDKGEYKEFHPKSPGELYTYMGGKKYEVDGKQYDVFVGDSKIPITKALEKDTSKDNSSETNNNGPKTYPTYYFLRGKKLRQVVPRNDEEAKKMADPKYKYHKLFKLTTDRESLEAKLGKNKKK